MGGLLALVGGEEFRPGNEPQDEQLLAGARPGPRYVVAAAAARQSPERAVETARAWFAGLGAEVEELPVRRRGDAESAELAARAAGAGLVYLTGGDPGLAVRTLRGSAVWEAIRTAWCEGAALAASSAGAMALCRCALLRDAWPARRERRPVDALGLVPVDALLPHFDTFGEQWVESAMRGFPADPLLVGVDSRTALLWDGSGWHVHGAGRVTVLTRDGRRVHAAGEEVGLAAPG